MRARSILSHARPSRVSTAGHGRGARDAARVLRRTGRAERGFEGGIQSALERMLVSFNFLFRIERTPANAAPGSVYRLSDLELASRLSFFLWSSIPDDTLLTWPSRGQLREPAEVLEQQVTRMLRDPRSRALVDSFASQWLRHAQGADLAARSEHLPGVRREPPPRLHPGNHDCSSTASCARIAASSTSSAPTTRSSTSGSREHYGVPGIVGERFRKRDVHRRCARRPARPGRHADGDVVPRSHGAGGARLLGAREPARHAATAAAARTCPICEATTEDGRPLSMRAQMETHRRNPAVRGLPRAHGSAGIRDGELRRHRPLAHGQRRRARRRGGGVRRRHADRRRAGTAPLHPAASRRLRAHVRPRSCSPTRSAATWTIAISRRCAASSATPRRVAIAGRP